MVHFKIVTSFLSKETMKQSYFLNVWERKRDTCFLSFCLDTFPIVYSPADGYCSFCIPFLHEPEFSFYIQWLKKNSLQHFIDQLHLCFFCYRNSKTLSYSCLKDYLLILKLLRFGSGNDMFSKQSRE